MLTIKELKAMPIGYKVGGGFLMTVKHTKKSMQKDNKLKAQSGWTQQVVFYDDTGDMLADINIKTYSPLKKGQQIKCIVCEIRDNYTRQGDKLLYVDQFEQVTMTVDEFEAMQDEEGMVWRAARDREIRGKIKCLYISSKIRTGVPIQDVIDFAEDERLDRLVQIPMEA